MPTPCSQLAALVAAIKEDIRFMQQDLKVASTPQKPAIVQRIKKLQGDLDAANKALAICRTRNKPGP